MVVWDRHRNGLYIYFEKFKIMKRGAYAPSNHNFLPAHMCLTSSLTSVGRKKMFAGGNIKGAIYKDA